MFFHCFYENQYKSSVYVWFTLRIFQCPELFQGLCVIVQKSQEQSLDI